jgi:putative MATE family efflux protein
VENRREMLEKAPLLGLLVRMSLPAMAGMLVMASYNVVDAVFIGHGVGPLGIAATSVAFPLQLFVNALAMWVAMGTASLASRKLGAGSNVQAEYALGNGFVLACILGALTLAAGEIWLDPLIALMGAETEVAEYSREYLRIAFLGNPLVILGMLLNSSIRAEGNTRYAMFSMIYPAMLNVFLDPLFIFGFKMGMAGAAWATVIGQVVTLLWVLRYYLAGKRAIIALRFSRMRLLWGIDRQIISVGASEFARSAALTLANAILMNQISSYGSPLHIAAFAIIMKVTSLAVMPVFGLGQGMQPIVGYCYGARLYERTRRTIEIALAVALVITSVGEFFLLAFPQVFALAFTDDAEVIKITVWGIRVLQCTFAIVGFQMIGSVTFQALGIAGPALFLSLARQVIFFIPSLLLLPRWFGITGVYLAYPVADVLAALTTFFFLLSYRGRLKKMERRQIEQ